MKCSVNNLTKVLPEITSVFFFVVSNVMKSNVVKYWLHLVQSTHTLNSKVKFTSFLKKEGGRHTPFFNNYRPQFYFRTTDVTGSIELPAGTEMVMPGDNVTIDVELIHPIAVEQGTTFSIREGGRTVGSGIVSEIEA